MLYSASLPPPPPTRWTCPGAWVVSDSEQRQQLHTSLAITGLGRSGRQHVWMLQHSPGDFGTVR